MSGSDAPGLTDADRRKLADMAERGPRPYAKHGGGRAVPTTFDPEAVTCENCGNEWTYLGDRGVADCPECRHTTRLSPTRAGDLTRPMCNAIREAARDGLAYAEVADLFGFVNGRRVARDHAAGRCSHTGGVEPVGNRRRSSPDVTAAECAALRRRYADGETVTDLERETGRDEATVYRHVTGECSHG